MDFIIKPFVPDVLVLYVRHIIELVRLQRDLAAEVEKKAQENEVLSFHLFQNLLLHVLSLGGGLFNFGIGWAAALLAIRQTGKCFLSLCYF